MATGKDVYVSWTPSGGSAIVVSTGKYVSFNPGIELETVDVTGGGDNVRVSEDTILKIEPEATLRVRTDNQTLRDALKEGTSGELEWGMEGNTAGRPKWAVTAKVVRANIEGEFDGELDLEVKWAVTSGDLVSDGRTAVYA